ncbi:MAG: DUF1007 family protein [Desulfomicrobium sp.]|nr:DUF1007 family protein [Desulfomicrobium sp.]
MTWTVRDRKSSPMYVFCRKAFLRTCAVGVFSVLLLVFMCLGWVFPRHAQAHPHVFAECGLALVFEDAGLAAVRQTWVFDEFYSAMVLMDLGLALSGDLDEAARKRVRAYTFDTLKPYDYFTRIRVDGERVAISDPRSFAARVHEGRLVFEFEIAAPVPALEETRLVTMAVYDESFYTFMDFPPLEVVMEGAAEDFDITWEDRDQTTERYFYDQITPVVLDVEFGRK